MMLLNIYTDLNLWIKVESVLLVIHSVEAAR